MGLVIVVVVYFGWLVGCLDVCSCFVVCRCACFSLSFGVTLFVGDVACLVACLSCHVFAFVRCLGLRCSCGGLFGGLLGSVGYMFV